MLLGLDSKKKPQVAVVCQISENRRRISLDRLMTSQKEEDGYDVVLCVTWPGAAKVGRNRGRKGGWTEARLQQQLLATLYLVFVALWRGTWNRGQSCRDGLFGRLWYR